MTTALKTNKQSPIAAALKMERERDKAQAVRDYEAENLAREANMIRLRALRLAKESADARTTMLRQSVKKKVAIRRKISRQTSSQPGTPS